MSGVQRVLKPTGAFWLAIGDEFAAELKLIAQNELALACRSWVIWYYTFGVNCTRAFSRSHTHLLYFVKDPNAFTFNADNPAVRVPSARQLVYADGRANPRGRLPDNTWILRPQDVTNGFAPDHDTWYFPRVAGTFKERQGFHGCQMPEQLLGRIIRCCSNPMETVLDPFGGSGTTLAVAKKLARQWIGFEISKDYVEKIRRRLRNTRVGAPLDGPIDPLSSAPPTVLRRSAQRHVAEARVSTRRPLKSKRSQCSKRSPDFDQGIVDAYKCVRGGCSADHLLADPELNAEFADACRRIGLSGDAVEWNRALLRIRKSGRLPRLENRAHTFTSSRMDAFSFASEVAMQQLSVEFAITLDGILCDPQLAARFDEIAKSFAPGYTPFQYRWAAFSIRKRAKDAKKLAESHYQGWLTHRLPRSRPISAASWGAYECPGVYLLVGQSRQRLYVGETLNLRQRIEGIREIPAWRTLEASSVAPIRESYKPHGLQSILIGRLNPLLNSQLLAPNLEAVT